MSRRAKQAKGSATAFFEQATILVITMVFVACGSNTTAATDAGRTGDVLRPPNSRYCPFFESTDGGVLRIGLDGRPTRLATAKPVFCHPDMRPNDPCIAPGGPPGRCRDFEYESSGRFPEFTQHNRMALYCRTEAADPCEGEGVLSENCEEWGNCVEVPNPLPGRPRYVCFPPVCN